MGILSLMNKMEEWELTDEQIKKIEENHGNCEDNFYWKLDENRTLFVTKYSMHDTSIIKQNIFEAIKEKEYKSEDILGLKDIKDESLEWISIVNIQNKKIAVSNNNKQNLLVENIEKIKDMSTIFRDFDFEKYLITDYKTKIISDILKGELKLENTMYENGIEHLEELLNIKITKMPTEQENLSTSLYKIVGVKQIANTRIAIMQRFNWNNEFNVLVLTPENQFYNYLDMGMLFLNAYRFEEEYIALPEIKTEQLTEKILDEMKRRNDIRTFITQNQFEEVIREAKRKEEKEKYNNKLGELVNERERELIKKIGTEPLIINGITVHNDHCLEYEGIVATFDKEIYNLTTDIFDNDFNGIINKAGNSIHYKIGETIHYEDKKHSFRLGKINFVIEVKSTTKKDDSRQNLYYVNGIRINKSETGEVFKKAICFNTQKDYDNFLSDINKCSIKVHTILANGLNVKMSYQNKFFKFNIVREKNINYVVLENKKYRIKNTNKLICLQTNCSNITELFEKITEVLNIDKNIVENIIIDGYKEHKKAIERSKQLLKETVELTNAEYVKVDDKEGWVVTGHKTQYFIEKENGQVYKYPAMQHICMVNKVSSLNIGYDDVVNKLLALKNDQLVIDEIYTLK